jgi:hypothetical protein
VGARVHDAVDEQRGGAPYLTGRQAALDIPLDPPQDPGSGPVVVEPRDVELELDGISPQVVVFERRLATEEQRVHFPEPVLQRGSLGGRRRGEGVRMDLRQRKVAEREADPAVQLSLDALDLSKRSARVRALVVAVLEDEPPGGRAADVIDLVVERLEAQNPTNLRMSTTWMRPGCSWWISRILPTALFCP